MSFAEEWEPFIAPLDKVKSIRPGTGQSIAIPWACQAGVSSMPAEDHRKAERLTLRREGVPRLDAAARAEAVREVLAELTGHLGRDRAGVWLTNPSSVG